MVRLRRASLRLCANCGSWMYSPRGSAAEQAALHDNAEYFDHPYFARRRTVTPAQRHRCRGVFQRLAVEPGRLRGERVLDIGCDTGTFLIAAREEFGIAPVGLDVAARAIAVAQDRGIEAHATSIERAPESLGQFNIITAIDLIEHVADPAAFLCGVRDRLHPGGVFYVETPNLRSTVFGFGSLLSRMTGGLPAATLERLFPPHHVQLFNSESLRSLAERNGLEVVRMGTRVLPGPDLAAPLIARCGLTALQFCDRLLGREILVWAVLRRATEAG